MDWKQPSYACLELSVRVETLRGDIVKGCKKRRQNLEFQREWELFMHNLFSISTGNIKLRFTTSKEGQFIIKPIVHIKRCTSRKIWAEVAEDCQTHWHISAGRI